VSRSLILTGDHDCEISGHGVERDRTATGHANGFGDAGDLSLAEAGWTARLALVGHDALPTALAFLSFSAWRCIFGFRTFRSKRQHIDSLVEILLFVKRFIRECAHAARLFGIWSFPQWL
jgi:hypothetical protein